MMRAKLTLYSVCSYGNNSATVVFNTVYDCNNKPEDNSYAEFTPSAELKMEVSNPALLAKLKPGQKFYVDFTLIEEPTPLLRTEVDRIKKAFEDWHKQQVRPLSYPQGMMQDKRMTNENLPSPLGVDYKDELKLIKEENKNIEDSKQ